MKESRTSFICQQGFQNRNTDEHLFNGLMFQPKLIGIVLAIGVLSQNAWLFALLGTVLWWCVLEPRLNVFEMLYNRLVADRRGWAHVALAPEPRRFAQGLASMLSVLIAASLAAGMTIAALVVEVLFAAAVIAMVFANFCFGSWAYWRLHRRLFQKAGEYHVRPLSLATHDKGGPSRHFSLTATGRRQAEICWTCSTPSSGQPRKAESCSTNSSQAGSPGATM